MFVNSWLFKLITFLIIIFTVNADVLCKKKDFKFPDLCEELNKNSTKNYFTCTECASDLKSYEHQWNYCNDYYTGEIMEKAYKAFEEIKIKMEQLNKDILKGNKKCNTYFVKNVDDMLKKIVDALLLKNKGFILEELENNWDKVDDKNLACFCTYRVPYGNLICNMKSVTASSNTQAFLDVFDEIYIKKWKKCNKSSLK